MKKAFDIMSLVRENVKALSPYRSARDEFTGKAMISLDANENPFDHQSLNRYPDPYQRKLKQKISALKGVEESSIFLGNGSDEAIDLLIRAFCEPGEESILTFTPTYGMYRISADINAVETVEVPLKSDFQIDLEKALKVDAKLTFICSPNNPTGNDMNTEAVETILRNSEGLVIVDEAYIDFSKRESWTKRLEEFPNLVVLQTLSKAYGLASIRLGMAFANEVVIEILNKIKPPYNVNGLTQNYALEALEDGESLKSEIEMILKDRAEMKVALKKLNVVKKIYPSEANFLLIEINRATELYHYLAEKGIVVRDRSKQVKNALRITIGTPSENETLLEAIKKFFA
ncbi:histidinol-phosphate transaminase [Cryomorphaceae bacterium 1068]|nr:histidinol-phosphate transaminase [Cryomorphaceae bacterium 1068]